MLRLHRDSSRSYPGRPARRGVVLYDSALCGNMQVDRAGVSKSHSRHGKPPLLAVWWVETSPAKKKSREVSSCRRAEPKEWGIVHMCSVT